MKKKIERRKRIAKVVLMTLMFVSLAMLISITGSAERFQLGTVTYIVSVMLCLAVFGVSAYLYDYWFNIHIK